MARPEKPDAEKLQKSVAFRLTEGDFEMYKKKFGTSGLTQSEFFREHVLSNTTKVIAKPIATQDAKRAVFLLAKASNNINQLAHRANSAHRAGKIADSTYAAILDQLQLLNQFMLDQAGQSIK